MVVSLSTQQWIQNLWIKFDGCIYKKFFCQNFTLPQCAKQTRIKKCIKINMENSFTK